MAADTADTHCGPTDSNGPVGPAGILLVRGSTFSLHNLSISLDASGKMSSTMEPKIAWEIWPMWLRIAIDNEAIAATARKHLLIATGDGTEAGQERARRLEEETRAGLVTISASAFAIEAMALSAGAMAGINGVGFATSSAKRACEVLKQCFDLPQFSEWRKVVIKIFKVRNDAVHPDAGLRDPLYHPAVNAAVPWPAHVYRYENAKASVTTGLHTALEAGRNPKTRHGKAFLKRAAAWKVYGEELRDYRRIFRSGAA